MRLCKRKRQVLQYRKAYILVFALLCTYMCITGLTQDMGKVSHKQGIATKDFCAHDSSQCGPESINK